MRCDPIGHDTVLRAAHDCAPTFCGCGSRRTFLKSITALGASSVIGAPAVWAQGTSQDAAPAPAAKPHRIDVHHHFYPPFLLDAYRNANIRIPSVMQRWSFDATLEQMDRGGIATAVLSLASAGLNFPNFTAEDSRQMARRVNEYAIKAKTDHAGRFGLFAFPPMPDIDGTLKEIEYALDVLKADGIELNTSYGNKWLGDPDFKPVMEDLNRRKAVVYVHPPRTQCCEALMSYVPASFAEYPQDTNRTVLSLLFSGTLSRLPDIRWIFSHGGAAVPLLAGRVRSLAKSLYPKMTEMAPNGVDYELRRLHYETANAAYAPNLAALLKYVPLSQVLFGSDYPYITVTENVADLLKAGLSAEELKAIDNANAMRLIPRLKA